MTEIGQRGRKAGKTGLDDENVRKTIQKPINNYLNLYPYP